MQDLRYKDKKVLILGGANQHLKLVEAAQELGIYTIVTDYLDDSPCKRICDESLMLNITDVDGIVEYCKDKGVNGVISGFLDPCQIPYGEICQKLGLPCLATPDQFHTFTNKRSFKELCKRNGVNTIRDYSESDIENGTIEYPVFVKPVDSRGSRGQSVCYSVDELRMAVTFAKEQSSDGSCLIEQYLGDCDEVQITCFVIDGKVYLERTVDSNRGSANLNLQKVVNCSISPSKYTDLYLNKAHSAICRMIEDLGIVNGPIFVQGFVKDNDFYFFDPGLRFPGVEFERIYKKVWGIDLAKLLVMYSVDGHFPQNFSLPMDGAKLKGNYAAVIFPVLRSAKIHSIDGEETWQNSHNVISYLTRYGVGDNIGWTFDVNQRYAEIDIVGSDLDEVLSIISSYYNDVKVVDECGRSMFFDKINTNTIKDSYINTTHNRNELSVCIIKDDDLVKSGCFNIPESFSITEKAFQKQAEGNVIFPDKVSVVFDEATQNRINCLPAGLPEDNVYGMKWISVFPSNPISGFPNVSSVILLSELKHGHPIAFMDGTLCSNLRTSSTSAVAAKYLAKKDSEVIGFIGAGEQAKSHLMSFLHVLPGIKICKVASRTLESEMIFINQMSKFYPNVQFVSCNSSYETAARDSDVIITAISGQEKILQAEWMKKGVFYCHVAGLEDDFSVPRISDKIVCDDWEVAKHRTQTISQMYHAGLLDDSDIYGNLADIVSGKLPGRVSDDEIIYFNTVGMSFVDIMLANHMYQTVVSHGYGEHVILRNSSMFDVVPNCIIR